MARTRIHFFATLAALLLVSQAALPAAESEKPDVLFIAVDDLNDWVGCLGGHPQAKTPNIDRLAQRGTLFTKAFCVAPACHPSRTAIGTGMRPATTGVFLNEGFKNTPSVKTLRATAGLEEFFKQHGYEVHVGGKVISGSEFKGPVAVAERNGTDTLKSFAGTGPMDGKDEDLGDYQLVDWAAKHLGTSYEKPLFLATGFIKPHLPLAVPRKWFDLHPLESVKLPQVVEKDLSDVPPAGVAMAKPDQHQRIVELGE